MIIALGSARAAKIMALRSACARIAATEARWKHVELIARPVETDAPRMPLNDTQLMRGAFGRARAVRELLSAEGTGRELGDVIDEVAGEHDVRSRQGAWGVLSRGLLTRSMSFETALVAAFAPFYNARVYK